MNNDIVKLKVVGITYKPIESGVYVAVLQEEEGDLRIPIVVGYSDAQAIECGLQTVATPRPLAHDMAVSMLKAFGINIESVMIRKLPDSVFTADIVLVKGDERHVVDARSSDAIAMALRMNVPIFTTKALLDEVGILANSKTKPTSSTVRPDYNDWSALSRQELIKKMEGAVADEDYELAAELKKELENRKFE